MTANLANHAILETVTPEAEEYARSLGLYDALLVTRELTLQMLPSTRGLQIDVEHDPEEDGYATIGLTISTPEPVERVVELNDALQKALFERIPPKARMYLSFAYQFEPDAT